MPAGDEKPPASIGGGVPASSAVSVPSRHTGGTVWEIKQGHLRFTQTSIFDVTPEAAQALVQSKKAEFERPAEEETKREELRQSGATTRQLISDGKLYIALVVFLFAFGWQLLVNQTVERLLLLMVGAILIGPRAWEVLREVLKKAGLSFD